MQALIIPISTEECCPSRKSFTPLRPLWPADDNTNLGLVLAEHREGVNSYMWKDSVWASLLIMTNVGTVVH